MQGDGGLTTASPFRHRDSWHNIGVILDSKANMASYIQEVCQQLGITYKPPALPVDMKYSVQAPVEPPKEEMFDADARMQDFRGMMHKHDIRLG